ncbi:hypothetical protein [Rhodococcus sp. ACT016]|uniref:hypothetical protein n=1 Tax=Rhodococcus sp. ACT016 TaxID=3134808 RepID=UPI003D267B24
MNGWHMAGSHPDEYTFEMTTESLGDKTVARLRCTSDSPQGFGTIMQTVTADHYLGHRIRFAGSLRANSVDGWAGLWLRVDGNSGTEAFDNMHDRAIRGTTGWARAEIVLDVGPHARAIAFGALLHGSGAIDISDLTFTQVGTDVPTTAQTPQMHSEPVNLDFSS